MSLLIPFLLAFALFQSEAQQEPPHFEQAPSRWFITPPPYEINEPGSWWNPYRQNILKGDFPIWEPDIFFSLTASEKLLLESRRVPTPSGNTGQFPIPQSFFGQGEQSLLVSNTAFTLDFFKGQQAFKPVDWRLKSTVIYNTTNLDVEEVGVVNVNPADGRQRLTGDIALQEALAEIHLMDLSSRYDFLSCEFGILPFRSDFRGFLFDDTNLGVRVFGNADENKWQYNLAYFNLLEKDTNSELNSLDQRKQQVWIANLFRQDWPVLGHTSSISFHYNRDEESFHFDENGFLVRPAPVGLASPHEVESYYFGWAGEGHFGRFNITSALYQAYGRDSDNPFAARNIHINAQFAALEISYDVDWLRFRLFGEYASGDEDTRDSRGEGFDAIFDAPNFAGGEFSFWNRQAIRLLGVNLTQRLSPLPDLSTSKIQGQSNFVNPGLYLIGGAIDAELTPTWRAQLGTSYLEFAKADPLEVYLELEDIDRSIGTEIFFGTQYRPLLTNNVILTFGASTLYPGNGLQKIYESDQLLYSVFTEMTFTF